MVSTKRLLQAGMGALAVAVLVLGGVIGGLRDGLPDSRSNADTQHRGVAAGDDGDVIGLESRYDDMGLDAEGRSPADRAPSFEEEVELTENLAPDEILVYRRTAGMNFHPLDSSTTYAYGNRGCLYRKSGTQYFTTDVQVPDGATIDYLRIYFYDSDPGNDARADFFAYDGEGNYTTLTSVSGSGTPGYDSAGSGLFDHQVSTGDEALAVVIGFGTASTDALKICGIRIRYTLPVGMTHLPLVYRTYRP